MKHRPISKQQLVANYVQERHNTGVVVGGRAGLLISLAILWDVFDFTREDMIKFCDSYQELFLSYADGNEDPADWYEGLKRECDIDVMALLENLK